MFVTNEQKNSANAIDLVSFLLSIGEPIKREGNYYRHQEHDSLVININRNYFSWNSKGVSGNAVTYLIHVHGMSFQEAVLKINSDLDQNKINTFTDDVTNEYLKEFIYDVNEVNHSKDVFNYLVNDRKIDEKLVKQLIDSDYIKQDNYRNVVFKWKDKEETIGASLQGTREIKEENRIHPDRKYFKRVLPNTEENTFSGFNLKIGYPKSIYFFESSIDLLSYVSLYRHKLSNCLLKSMDGLKHQTVIKALKNTIDELKNSDMDLNKIMMCVDNDKAGRDFINKISVLSYTNKNDEVVRIQSHMPEKPKGVEKWDWNNELKYDQKILKQEQIIEL